MRTLSALYYRTRELIGSYVFILPAALLFLIFSAYPFYKVFSLSMFAFDGISPQMQHVGFRHFVDIFNYDQSYWRSMSNAAVITVLALVFQNLFALALALCCDRSIRFGGIYSVIFFIPPVLSGIVAGLIWGWICDGQSGLFNHFLGMVGLEHLQRAWLGDPHTALYTVAIIHMWKGFGWGFLIFLAGLQTIPREYYEAARVDGAGSWHVFWHVTMPLLFPVCILVSILTILGSMQMFDIILATTYGGPGWATEVPVTRILTTMTSSSQYGYACAMGVVFGVILLFVSLANIRLSKELRQT